ncbi:MAG: DUF4276 family protein [Deltaproteobacteria bacterium]|nr:DUF4276 family protein [Deltaproteobacteria bacterium]
MKCLVFLLEEPSAMEMIKELLPRLLPEAETFEVKFIVFEGKQDLEKQLVRKIKLWMRPNSQFLVMRDQDSGNCITIKDSLQEKVNNTGKQNETVIRIACRELESFYLGDLLAVEQGLSLSGFARHQDSKKYRSPDNLVSPSLELLKLTKKNYQKVAGSRAIGKHLKTDGSNRSHSFNTLLQGIRKQLDITR